MNIRRFVPAQLPDGFMNEQDANSREAKRRILQMHVDSGTAGRRSAYSEPPQLRFGHPC